MSIKYCVEADVYYFEDDTALLEDGVQLTDFRFNTEAEALLEAARMKKEMHDSIADETYEDGDLVIIGAPWAVSGACGFDLREHLRYTNNDEES